MVVRNVAFKFRWRVRMKKLLLIILSILLISITSLTSCFAKARNHFNLDVQIIQRIMNLSEQYDKLAFPTIDKEITVAGILKC